MKISPSEIRARPVLEAGSRWLKDTLGIIGFPAAQLPPRHPARWHRMVDDWKRNGRDRIDARPNSELWNGGWLRGKQPDSCACSSCIVRMQRET
jgi:hypothetical protein